MRICVAVPSIHDFYFTPHRMTALGARTVLALCRREGHEAVLLDFPRMRRRPARAPFPDRLSHLHPFVHADETGPASFFTHYRRMGPGAEECAAQAARIAPELVLISSFAFAYADDALALSAALRRALPGVPIVAGGAGVSAYPQYYLRTGSIDLAVMGEAEVSLPALLAEIGRRNPDWDQVPNLVHPGGSSTDASRPQRPAAGDELTLVWGPTSPRPSGGQTGLSRSVAMSLSRGCPKACRFCSNHLCHGRRFRTVPAAAVEASLPALSAGRLHVGFEDDNILCDERYFFTVLEMLRRSAGRFTFTMENGMDGALVTNTAADRLVRCGLLQANLSVGTVDERLVARQRRAGTGSRITELVRLFAARGVPVVTYFICGLEGDSASTTAENLTGLHALGTRIGISPFYAVPGLPGFEDRARFGRLPSHLCCGSSMYPWNASLTTRELVTAFRLARLLNLIGEAAPPVTDAVTGAVTAAVTGGATEAAARLLEAVRRSRRLFSYFSPRGSAGRYGDAELREVPNTDDALVEAVLSRAL